MSRKKAQPQVEEQEFIEVEDAPVSAAAGSAAGQVVVEQVGAAPAWSDAQSFYQKHKTKIFAGAAGIVLVVGGIFYWRYSKAESAKTAAKQMIYTFNYFERDSLKAVLGGTAQSKSLQQLADEYSGTPAGNTAQYLLASAKLQSGKPDEALDALSKFDRGDDYVGVSSYAAAAAAYEAKNDFAKAAEEYERASGLKNNDFVTPYLLKEAGRCYELAKNNEKALEVYKKIKQKYPKSEEAKSIDKYIARLGE